MLKLKCLKLFMTVEVIQSLKCRVLKMDRIEIENGKIFKCQWSMIQWLYRCRYERSNSECLSWTFCCWLTIDIKFRVIVTFTEIFIDVYQKKTWRRATWSRQKCVMKTIGNIKFISRFFISFSLLKIYQIHDRTNIYDLFIQHFSFSSVFLFRYHIV